MYISFIHLLHNWHAWRGLKIIITVVTHQPTYTTHPAGFAMFFCPWFLCSLPQIGFVSFLQHCPPLWTLLAPFSRCCPQSLSSSRALTGLLWAGRQNYPKPEALLALSFITVSQAALPCHKGGRTVLLSATATGSNTLPLSGPSQPLSTFVITSTPSVSVPCTKIRAFSSSNLKLSNGGFKLTCQVLNLIPNMGYLFANLNTIKVQI